MPATLFLTCGLPGSGKTTLARRLEGEKGALRLTADEWLHHLHPDMPPDDLDRLRDRVERLQWATALRVLAIGGSVIIDWGLWARAERDLYRSQARVLGARVVLCLLEPSRPELLDRLAERDAKGAPGSFRVTPDQFRHAWQLWQRERPNAEELALFDAVVRADLPLNGLG